MSSSEKQNQIISLTLVVDKKKQKVLYAEAGKDFVDVLLNFLTLPLSTVSKLVSEESTNAQPCRFNCITSLHRSVEKMDLKYFFDNGDKERLLNPRSPVISYYQSIGLYNSRKLLFAEADDDFMDQLLSFLTIPVAAVQRLEQGNSDLGCIDNLYKSCTNLDAARYFDPNMRDLKDKLLNPLIAPIKIKNQLLPIYPSGRETSCFQFIGDYVKRGTNFMVTDDLCVEPFSSPSAFSFLVESKVVDEQDLEIMHLSVGVNEVFGILKAAMLSTSALTIGLRPLLTVKEDK